MRPGRGRFEVIAVVNGAFVRWKSDKTRSLSPDEIARLLRDIADRIDQALAAAALLRGGPQTGPDDGVPALPKDPR